MVHKNRKVSRSLSPGGDLPGRGTNQSLSAEVPQGKEPAAQKTGIQPTRIADHQNQRNGMLLNAMLETYIRGSDEGSAIPRAAQLTEKLVDMALYAEDPRLRFDATRFIFERVDGKAVERKEIKSMKIEGIIYIPQAEKSDAVDA